MYLKAVAMPLLTAYPLLAFVTSLMHLGPESFIPCNDAPCSFSRIFPGEGLPGTGAEVVHVQNGVTRPIQIDWSGSTAEAVPYGHDGPAKFEADAETQVAIEKLTQALQQWGPPFFLYRTINRFNYYVRALFVLMFHPFIDQAKNGAELLPSARCGAEGANASHAVCESQTMRAGVMNALGSSPSARFYIVGLTGWAAGNMAHDVMLLAGTHPLWPRGAGAASYAFQLLAVGAGFMLGMTAAAVFVSPRETSRAEEPCVCYYKLDDLRTLLLIGTPCLLMYHSLSKCKYLFLSLLSGDYLFCQQYEVPHQWAQQSPRWATHSLMLPHSQAFGPQTTQSEARGLREGDRSSFDVQSFKYGYVFLTSYMRVAYFSKNISLWTAVSALFTRAMAIAATNWGRGSGLASITAGCVVLAPPLSFAGGAVYHAWYAANRFVRCFRVTIYSSNALLLAYAWCSLERAQWTAHFQYAIAAYAPLWQSAGFMFAVTVVNLAIHLAIGSVAAMNLVQIKASIVFLKEPIAWPWLQWVSQWGSPCTTHTLLIDWAAENKDLVEVFEIAPLVEIAHSFQRDVEPSLLQKYSTVQNPFSRRMAIQKARVKAWREYLRGSLEIEF